MAWNPNETIDLGQGFNVDSVWREDRRRRQLQQLQAQQKPQQSNNLLASLLPTGGGIGGALAGGAAGAAAGSIVPGVGTAVGGLIGAVLGGAGGSAAGKVGENAIEGRNLDDGVLNEALIGGATSMPVGAAFKVARAGLKAGTGIGGKSAGTLLEEAGTATVGKKTAAKYGLGDATTTATRGGATKLGKQAEDVGAQMLNSQTQITGAQARRMGLNPTETIKSVNARTGLTNLDDMAEVSRGLTGNGQDSMLDTLTRAAVDNTSGVDVGDLRKLGNELLDNKGTLLTKAQRTQILDNIKNASTAMHGGAGGSLSPLANPGAALDQANKFRAAARTIQSKSLTATPEQEQMASIYNGLAKQIEDGIYKSPGVSESIPMLAKAGADDLLFRAQDLRAAGNTAQAKAYEKIAQELRGVKDVKQLRSMKKDFVNISKMDELTGQVAGSRSIGGADMTSSLRNPLNLVGMGLEQATPAVGGAITRAGRALQGGGEAATQAASQAGQRLVPLAARQGITRAVLGDGTNTDQADPEIEAQIAALMDEEMAQGQEMQAPEPSIGGITQSQLEQAMSAAMANGDSEAFSQLQAMYEMLPKVANEKLGATAAQQLGASENALSTLGQLEGLYKQAGGGSGKLGGTIKNKLAAFGLDDNTQTFNELAGSSVTQLAKALNSGGQVTDADAEVVISALPKVTDSPQVAQQKLQALKARLLTARQNTLMYGAGAVPDQQQQLY
ncbi:hypothetical protein GS464_20085 [Rhodococcus hoagii]|nr:hypothetical protein [Prescottella equi]